MMKRWIDVLKVIGLVLLVGIKEEQINKLCE